MCFGFSFRAPKVLSESKENNIVIKGNSKFTIKLNMFIILRLEFPVFNARALNNPTNKKKRIN